LSIDDLTGGVSWQHLCSRQKQSNPEQLGTPTPPIRQTDVLLTAALFQHDKIIQMISCSKLKVHEKLTAIREISHIARRKTEMYTH